MHALAVLLSILGMACAVEIGGEQEFSDVDSALMAKNKLTTNKLTTNKLTTNSLATIALAEDALEPHAMLDTADRRDVLSYIVSCALSADQVLTLTEDESDVTYEFHGAIGLAPAWATRAPTVSERRWVSACVLARTNLYGTEVSISMRSDTNPVLTAESGEATLYSRPEGAFYGDLFESTPVMYACNASTWIESTPEQPRACALSADGIKTRCDFTYTMVCDVDQPCLDSAAPFGGCAGGTTTYDEIVTVYLKN